MAISHVEENADIEKLRIFTLRPHLYGIFNLLFFCIIIRQIKKNHIKGGKGLVRTCVFPVKAGTPLATPEKTPPILGAKWR